MALGQAEGLALGTAAEAVAEVEHFAPGLRAVLALGRDQALDEAIEIAAEVGLDRTHGAATGGDHLVQRLVRGVAGDQAFAGDHAEQHRPEHEHVGADVAAHVVAEMFGREVVLGRGAGAGQFAHQVAVVLGDADLVDQHVAVGIDQHDLGTQPGVDDALARGFFKGEHDLARDLDRMRRGQHAPARQHMRQRF